MGNDRPSYEIHVNSGVVDTDEAAVLLLRLEHQYVIWFSEAHPWRYRMQCFLGFLESRFRALVSIRQPAKPFCVPIDSTVEPRGNRFRRGRGRHHG